MQTRCDRIRRTLDTHGAFHTVPSCLRLQLNIPELSKSMVQGISQLEAARQLEYLTIRIHRVTPILQLLCNLSSLKALDLSETCITYEEIRLLRQCHTLVKIDLYSCKRLTNVDPLSSIASLEVIDLSDCTALTHLGALGRLPALKEVDFSGTRITDEDVRLLSECQTLVNIFLIGCEALTNVNPFSFIATLEVIDLSYCTSLIHVGALGKLPVLKEVYLTFTRITDEEVRLLSECRTLVKINLSFCRKLTNVNPLSSIATLEVIGLNNSTFLSQVGALGKLPVLKEVDLSSTRITDEEVRLLSECRTLVKIEFHSCKALTNVNSLSSIATLEIINLSRCTSLTNVGALGSLPALKEIDFSGTHVTNEVLNSLNSLREQLSLTSMVISRGF